LCLVLAYGNPLRGDDGVAWRIAERLGGDPAVEIVCVQQLVPELADTVARAAGVLFLDAAVGEEAGHIAVRRLKPVAETTALGHLLAPSRLLDLARLQAGAAPEAVLMTVVGRDFGFSEALSRRVAEALPRAVQTAQGVIRALSFAGARTGARG
jgi:hydrogenase maturation protease